MRNVKLIEVPSELGAGTRGASLGIDAMKIAALDAKSNFFATMPQVCVADNNDLLYQSVSSPYAKRINGVCQMWERISEEVKSCIEAGSFPVVLAGDHSNAGGTIAGLKMAQPNSRLGVIWIDAHADMHTPYTTPSGNVHGMPLAACLGEDNEPCKVNEVDQATADWWNKMKAMGGVSPQVEAQDIVFIALRDYEKEESAMLERLGIKIITVDEVRQKGVAEVVSTSLSYLKDCSEVYVSFDVDSMDSSISKGTGTPVANGLSVQEAEGICTLLMESDKICCFEITEVNPTLDSENVMAETAFGILQKCVHTLSA